MVHNTIESLSDAAVSKVGLLNQSVTRYFVLSMMAGVYVGLGIVLVFSIGAPLASVGSPGLKALMGASFGVALTLVIFAGSELFTGNNMIMTIGCLCKKVTWRDTARLWAGVSSESCCIRPYSPAPLNVYRTTWKAGM